MAWRISEVFGAEPLPVVNPTVVPNGPALLEGQLQQCDDESCEKEIGQVHDQQ